MSASRKSSCVKLHVGVSVLDRISEAVRNGDEEKFRELISLFKLYEAANLNQLDSCGSHPLHEAVTFRRQRMLQTLLHYRNALRLDVNITNMHGETALDIAVRNKNSQALKKLLKYDCSAEILKELREQLGRARHCPLSPIDIEASCRSEIIMVHHHYHQRYPTETKRSTARHLLHPISGTHWSGEICKKAVLKCYHSLTKFMDPVYIIPLLVEPGYLNPEQVDRILSYPTKTEQALQLLALLNRSGGNAYQGLFKALKEETEHKPHQELLQQLERTCESLVNSGYESAGQCQENLEEVTTVYHGDDLGTPVLDQSIELSDRTESGIYSATPTTMQGTHSSGKMSTPSQRISSQGSRKKSTSEKNPNIFLMKDKINRRACANFRAPDERQPRPSLHVINTVVKRDPAPVQETVAKSNADSGACLVTGTGFQRVLPPDTQTLLQSIPNTLECVSFFIASNEKEEEDDIEKDASVEVPAVSSPKGSAPIDIPSRNESCTTLARSSAQDSASVSSRDGRSPRAALMTRQTSTDTSTSSDTSSSDDSYIVLDTAPKDLSHIPPLRDRWSWRKAFAGLVARFNSTPSGTGTIPTTSSSRSGNGGPSYVMGCGIRM